MKIITLEKADDIHKVLKKYRKSAQYKFRGQSDSDWKLIPKTGRKEILTGRDKEIFRHWKRRALSFLPNHNLTNWEYLAIAQHTGLPTRLLDWTHNPLTAAFFSANENTDKSGVLWVAKPKHFVVESLADPFELEEGTIHFYQPSTVSQRVANQLGYFTIHNKPGLELTEDTCELGAEIDKIIIPKQIKQELIFGLHQYGVNYLSIYPDLEGLSKHLSWFTEKYEYWDGSIEE
jgi:hypothetical protein